MAPGEVGCQPLGYGIPVSGRPASPDDGDGMLGEYAYISMHIKHKWRIGNLLQKGRVVIAAACHKAASQLLRGSDLVLGFRETPSRTHAFCHARSQPTALQCPGRSQINGLWRPKVLYQLVSTAEAEAVDSPETKPVPNPQIGQHRTHG